MYIFVAKMGKKVRQKSSKHLRTDLEELTSYLDKEKVEIILMESTGVYWISLYHKLMCAKLDVIVANPQHIKQMPKRKTDRKDAKWLCTLAINGLVRKSFVPERTRKKRKRKLSKVRLVKVIRTSLDYCKKTEAMLKRH